MSVHGDMLFVQLQGEGLVALQSIAKDLTGINVTLDQIDSKMPFEERELAAEKAERETALRHFWALISASNNATNPNEFGRGVLQGQQYWRNKFNEIFPDIVEQLDG